MKGRFINKIKSQSRRSKKKKKQQDDELDSSSIPRHVLTTHCAETPSPIRDSVSSEEVNRIVQAAAALDDYGNSLFEQGEYGNAMISYSKALKLKKRTLSLEEEEKVQSVMLASVATSINNISYLRQRSGANTKETMAAYRDSLEIKQQILGRNNLSVAKTLNNIGSVHFSNKEYDNAMEAYREAHSVMCQNLGHRHLDVATVQSNIGDVYLARGDIDKAGGHYRQALGVRWGQLGNTHPKVTRLLEKVALIEMGELKQAQEIGLETTFEEEPQASIPYECNSLAEEVKKDMRHLDNVKRQMAIDLVQQKLQMRREIRALDANGSVLVTPTRPATPLSPDDRSVALASVKNRLAKLRESRQDENEHISSDAPQRSNLERATARHLRASENVKERLERLRSIRTIKNTLPEGHELSRIKLEDTFQQVTLD